MDVKFNACLTFNSVVCRNFPRKIYRWEVIAPKLFRKLKVTNRSWLSVSTFQIQRFVTFMTGWALSTSPTSLSSLWSSRWLPSSLPTLWHQIYEKRRAPFGKETQWMCNLWFDYGASSIPVSQRVRLIVIGGINRHPYSIYWIRAVKTWKYIILNHYHSF